MLKPLTLTLISSLIAFGTASAQTDSSRTDTTDISFPERVIGLAETVLDWLTVEREDWSVAIYPAASYSSRQGLAIGVMPLLQVRSRHLPKPMTLTPSALVSTKKMFEVQCDADIYLPHSTDITLKFETYRQPDDYYAPGGAKSKEPSGEYDFMRRMLTAEVSKGIGKSFWRIGAMLDADYYSFSNVVSTDSAAILRLAADGGGSYGLGGLVGYDSRDDMLAPTSGAFIRLKGMGYAAVLGSSRRFGLLTIDARRYWPLPLNSVLACQAYASHTWGDAPFVKMPSFAGTRLGRAVGHSLKYVDNEAWLLQGEWRVPLFWRIGATCFIAGGNACDNWSEALRDVHLMAGGGLRFSVFPGKGLNLRLDGGIGTGGDHAIYFNIREAF